MCPISPVYPRVFVLPGSYYSIEQNLGSLLPHPTLSHVLMSVCVSVSLYVRGTILCSNKSSVARPRVRISGVHEYKESLFCAFVNTELPFSPSPCCSERGRVLRCSYQMVWSRTWVNWFLDSINLADNILN